MKIFYVLLLLLSLSTGYIYSQKTNVQVCTENDIASNIRPKFRSQAEQFLRSYYSGLLFNVDNAVIKDSYIERNMLYDKQNYKPEFIFTTPKQLQFLTPAQYMMELDKNFQKYDTDLLTFEIEKVSVSEDIYKRDMSSVYVVVEYNLLLKEEERILMNRRCRAYCLFPNALVYVEVKLMQVEPLQDIITYTERHLGDDDQNALYQKASQLFEQKKYEEALDLIRKLAAQGHAESQGHLAYCYQTGVGVLKNLKTAFQYHKLAAENGYKESKFNLGYCYQHGIGIEKNPQKAYHWYGIAAKEGLKEAQYVYGTCHQFGIGTQVNAEEAFKWYNLSAEQGHIPAYANLSFCYFKSFGTRRNYKKAFEYATYAAKEGNAVAQSYLGYYYYNGIGVSINTKRAVEWYTKAAKNGDAEAQKVMKKLNISY